MISRRNWDLMRSRSVEASRWRMSTAMAFSITPSPISGTLPTFYLNESPRSGAFLGLHLRLAASIKGAAGRRWS